MSGSTERERERERDIYIYIYIWVTQGYPLKGVFRVLYRVYRV